MSRVHGAQQPRSPTKAAVRVDVLLLEDDVDTAAAVRYMLQSTKLDLPPDWPAVDLRVDEVHELGSALRLVKDIQVQVILTDLNLPDSVGGDTVLQLHRAAPEVPIVVMTSMDDVPTAMEATMAGASEFLSKDEMTPESLARAVAVALMRRNLPQDV